jgi:hypothetical protein
MKRVIVAAFAILLAFSGCRGEKEPLKEMEMKNTELQHQNDSLNGRIRVLLAENDSLRAQKPTPPAAVQPDARALLERIVNQAKAIRDAEGQYEFLLVVLSEAGRAKVDGFKKELEKLKLQAEPGCGGEFYYVTPQQRIYGWPPISPQITKSESLRTLDGAVEEVKKLDGVAKVYPCRRMLFPCVLVWESSLATMKLRVDIELLGIEAAFFDGEKVNMEKYDFYDGGGARVIITRSLVSLCEDLAYKLEGRKIDGAASLTGKYMQVRLLASEGNDLGTKAQERSIFIAGVTDRIDRFAVIVIPEAVEDWNRALFEKAESELKTE